MAMDRAELPCVCYETHLAGADYPSVRELMREMAETGRPPAIPSGLQTYLPIYLDPYAQERRFVYLEGDYEVTWVRTFRESRLTGVARVERLRSIPHVRLIDKDGLVTRMALLWSCLATAPPHWRNLARRNAQAIIDGTGEVAQGPCP